jgi:antitoxin (DNA-binding transcriptional repressor) of toxin-antitoxin stability system
LAYCRLRIAVSTVIVPGVGGLVWSGLVWFLSSGRDGNASGRGLGWRRTVNRLEAKTHLACLVEAIENGEATEGLIARNSRPVAQLTALAGPERPRRLGMARVQFSVPVSIDAADPLVAELFEQACCGFCSTPILPLGDQ